MTTGRSAQFKKQVNALIAQMTLEEKIAQIGSCWVYELQKKGTLDPDKMAQKLKNGIGQISRNAGACNQYPLETARSANTLQRFLVEETRLGIPAIIRSFQIPAYDGIAKMMRPSWGDVLVEEENWDRAKELVDGFLASAEDVPEGE